MYELRGIEVEPTIWNIMETKISNNKALLALAVGGFGIGLTEFVIMGILPDVAKD